MSSLTRGRTLDKNDVARAKNWRKNRLNELLGVHRLELSRKERNEARRLTGRWDFWNYTA